MTDRRPRRTRARGRPILGAWPRFSPTPSRSALAHRRILVVEDDDTVREVVQDLSRGRGLPRRRGGRRLRRARCRSPRAPPTSSSWTGCCPAIDGAEVCRRIRASADIPVILLTALSGTEDRIDGLEAGADDYITKPFSPRELVLRVHSVLRRTLADDAPEAPFGLGAFYLHPSARFVQKHGMPLALSAREFDLFAFLLKHPDRAFTRAELLSAVWGWELRRSVHRHRHGATTAREGGGRPGASPHPADGVGRRLPTRDRGCRMIPLADLATIGG